MEKITDFDADLCLTWVSNCTAANFPEYLVFFKSLVGSGFDGKIVVITDNLAEPFRLKLKSLGVQIIPAKNKVRSVVRDRFFEFWHFLNTLSVDESQYVMLLDARDVVVQKNPLIYIRRSMYEYCVILTNEGFTHGESQCNLIDQFEAQRNLGEHTLPYTQWPVVNGGVMFGKARSIKDFCFLIWSNILRVSCSDQAVVNYLFHFLKNDPRYFLADPASCLLTITGEAIKQNLLKSQIVFDKGMVCNAAGEPFCVFHQWDRTVWKQSILNRYQN